MGFKRLTPENWLERDSVMHAFVHGAMSGKPYVPTGEQRVQEIMSIELSKDVPLEVRKLFAVVRGVLCYGYFFYPLYALASEQLSRVAETAVTLKYEALGGPKLRKTSFQGKLDYLKREGLITQRVAVWWGAIREARNDASHPRDHRAQPPRAAVSRAETLAEKITGYSRLKGKFERLLILQTTRTAPSRPSLRLHSSHKACKTPLAHPGGSWRRVRTGLPSTSGYAPTRPSSAASRPRLRYREIPRPPSRSL